MDSSDLAFDALVEYLRNERGFDFTGYKRPSLVRRVRRQMQLVGVESYEEYLDYLQVHPEEFTALFNMILINVTSFFRDADAWEHLRDERPAGAAARPARAARCGCGARAAPPGEEAYSLAIVLAEALGPEEFRSRVKIYATDVDEEALAQARQATTPAGELADLPDGAARAVLRAGRRRPLHLPQGPAAMRHLRPQRPGAGRADLPHRPARLPQHPDVLQRRAAGADPAAACTSR